MSEYVNFDKSLMWVWFVYEVTPPTSHMHVDVLHVVPYVFVGHMQSSRQPRAKMTTVDDRQRSDNAFH